MDSERILQLLSKQFGQAASEEDKKELKELLRQHPEYQLFKEIILSLRGERFHKESAVGEDELVEEGWSMLRHEIDGKKDFQEGIVWEKNISRKLISQKWLRIAAVLAGVILIAGIGIYNWKYSQRKGASTRVIQIEKQLAVPYGKPREMTLPDSSVVWLNAGSHIRYANNFIQQNREIYLDGEAYFKVKHDAKHPFLVHAGNIVIKVLGTEFNVQAYQDENRIETTLISGKVQVQIDGKPDKKIILTRHEKLTVVNEEFGLPKPKTKTMKEMSFQVKEVVPLQTTTPIPEVAWTQDKLAFQNESFDELSRSLERRYDVHIIFRDTLLENERLSGVFENETIQKALKILQMTTPFMYKMQKDTVYLMR